MKIKKSEIKKLIQLIINENEDKSRIAKKFPNNHPGFDYIGYHFTPYIKFKNSEDSFFYFSEHISGDARVKPRGYDWDDFYKIAKKNGCGDCDLFIVNNDKNYIIMPGKTIWRWNWS